MSSTEAPKSPNDEKHEHEQNTLTTQHTPSQEKHHDHSSEERGNPTREPPSNPGWKYRPWTYPPFFHIPAYASPPFQLALVALVCFLCPGMFNAVNGLGGGGQFNASTADNSNVALYSTFSVVGFFAGSIANRLGIRWTLSLGGGGYVLYICSFLSYNHTANEGFVIFAGAVLGACAGMLWAAQGAVMMSYPPEGSKGKYISWFWMVFNLGAVIGGLIPLGENIHSSSGTVTDGTYIGFIVLTFTGALLAWTLVDAHQVVRSDGSHVILMKHPSWQSEILGLLEVLKTDIWILFLFPMFFASNWFYTYQFNDFNSARFNIRTRSLNSVLYYLSQIIGAYIFGYALDTKSIRRSTKAKIVWAVLLVITFAIWGGGYAFERQYTRAETAPKGSFRIDWTDGGYVGPMFLYMFYGFYDAAWQTTVYWLMGAMTNNGRKLANFAGFYKGLQSAGAAIAYRIDALGAPFANIFASNWALLAGSLLIAGPMVWMKVRDSVPVGEDLRFTDESYEDVKPLEPDASTPEGMLVVDADADVDEAGGKA